jgi:hypothetical protein
MEVQKLCNVEGKCIGRVSGTGHQHTGIGCADHFCFHSKLGKCEQKPVLGIRIRISKICMFLGLPDLDPDPDPSVQNWILILPFLIKVLSGLK